MGMMGEMSPAGRWDEAAAPGELAARGQLRASHQDRDRVVEILRVAAGDGRLTSEELDERLEAALSARTFGELAALTRDLPASPGFGVAPVREPRDVGRLDCPSGSARRDARGGGPPRVEGPAASGGLTR